MDRFTGYRLGWWAVLCWSLAGGAKAMGGLVAGDVAIIGVNSDNPDEFAWTPLVDLAAGQEVWFSDAGWLGGQFSGAAGASHDGAVKFVAPAGGTPAGAVHKVTLSSLPAEYASANDALVGGDMSFSPAGDQVVAFSGSSAAPTFLFGVNLRGGQWGAPTSPSADLDSDLYPGLTDGVSALSIGVGPNPGDEYDNARYTGLTSGTRAALLAAISDESNWQGAFATGNDRFADLANGAVGFHVQGASVPEPSGLTLGVLAAIALGALGRRRSAKRAARTRN